MTAWDLTNGLVNLRNQVNSVFPTRDKKSDGTIGDAAHQAGTSGHNPDDSPGNAGKPEWSGDPDANPEVRAWDMDSDLNTKGVTTQQLVIHIAGLSGVEKVLRYMIFNRKLYHSRNGFAPVDYLGPSPHTEHVHFSGAWTQAADENTSFNYRLKDLLPRPAKPEEDVATPEEIAKAVWDYKFDDPYTVDDPKNPGADDKTAGTMQRYADSRGQGEQGRAQVADLDAKVTALQAQLDTMETLLGEIRARLSTPTVP